MKGDQEHKELGLVWYKIMTFVNFILLVGIVIYLMR